jgi:hypothetical protein
MARHERSHRRGRLETNLVRLPLAESNDHRPAVRPFVDEALLGGFRTTIRLKQLDLMVLAFVLERWWWQAPERDSVPAQFTLRELGQAVYGRDPAGHERRLLRAALSRLFDVAIDFAGFDAATRQTGARWGRVPRPPPREGPRRSTRLDLRRRARDMAGRAGARRQRDLPRLRDHAPAERVGATAVDLPTGRALRGTR